MSDEKTTIKKRNERNLDLSVNIGGVVWKNPIGTASGTFSMKESGSFYDLNSLGALTTKGVAIVPWEGNPTPRIAETYGGMLNSVGLQNNGIQSFIQNELPDLERLDTNIIVNVVGHTIEEYCQVVERLSDTNVDMLEINISCPNVKEGGIGFGTSSSVAAEITKAVKRVAKQPVIVKLTPNVTDIAEIAKAVEQAGADAISLINTLLGMRIDVHKRKPVLHNKVGGLSGPAIKPVAVRMVYQVRKAVQIPIIGLGGIMTGEDAVEFLMAGSDAIEIGTAALVNPTAPTDILDQLSDYMKRYHFNSIQQLKEAFQDEL